MKASGSNQKEFEQLKILPGKYLDSWTRAKIDMSERSYTTP